MDSHPHSAESCRHRPLTTSLQQPAISTDLHEAQIARVKRRNLLLYYAFSFLVGFYIATGTTVLFEQRLGLSYAQIFTLDALYMLMFVFFEVPSGALADLLGRKKTILAGLAILILAAIATGNAQNFVHLFLSSIIWAIGFSLISGSSEALLYDSLKDDKLFHRATGRAMSCSIIGLALAGVVGPPLFALDFRLPYLSSALPFAAALLIMGFYREGAAADKEPFSAAGYARQIRNGTAKAFSNRYVLWSMGALAIVFSVSYTFSSAYQPYLIQVGFSVSQFAFILPLMFLSEALGGAWSEKITSRFGETAAFWGNILMLGASLVALGLIASKFAVPILILYGFLQGFLRPLASAYANRHIASEHRATVISVQVMASTIAASALLFLFGFVTDRIGVVALAGLLGALVLIAGVALLLAKPSETKS
jgi:MFS family permease